MRNRAVVYWLISVLLILHIHLFGQNSFDRQSDSLFNEVLSLNGKAIDVSNSTININTNSWLQAYSEFLSFHFGNEGITNEYYQTQVNEQIEAFEKQEEKSVLYYSSVADMYLFKAITNIYSHEYYQGWRSIAKAENYVRELTELNAQSFLSLRHNYIQFAFEYLFYKNIPFPFTNRVALIKSELERIQNELLALTTVSQSFKRELSLLIIAVNKTIGTDSEELEYLVKNLNVNWAMQGPLETLIVSQVEKSKQSKYALKKAHAAGYMNVCNKLNLHYANAFLYELNDSAELFYLKYLEYDNTGKDRLNAMHKLCWNYYIKDDVQNLSIQLKEINKLDAITEKDKVALFDLNNYENWNKELLTARLFFDGAYYYKALNVFENSPSLLSVLNDTQKMELNYRLGRIYSALNKSEQALIYYKKVADAAYADEFYYPAYSAFYAGEIFELLGKFEMATQYYEQCIELNSPIYERSVHEKAADGIKRCKK